MKFGYDYQSRRVGKAAWAWNTNTSAWSQTVSNCFVYDGWNLVGEFNATNQALIRIWDRLSDWTLEEANNGAVYHRLLGLVEQHRSDPSILLGLGEARDRELSEAFRYNRATDTAASRQRLSEGDRYVMRVRLPQLEERLAGKVIMPSVARIGTTLSVESVVEKLQSEVVVAKDGGEQVDRIVDLRRR